MTFTTVVNQWEEWKKDKPSWMVLAYIGAVFFIYYITVISLLDYAVSRSQKKALTSLETAKWMSKASQEIIALRQLSPPPAINVKEKLFTVIDESIKSEQLSAFLTNVQQEKGGDVQVTFNKIPFNDLVHWLKRLNDSHRIYALEATLQKSDPGLVQASLVMQQSGG